MSRSTVLAVTLVTIVVGAPQVVVRTECPAARAAHAATEPEPPAARPDPSTGGAPAGTARRRPPA